ncbi:2-hydroxychromene-2-carboxylate isomerase [Cupriavidus sp. RAF12]|uniref:2-hydroxychromene-2-carboxylate isomerase n=1 Tax=Cupriavidus sp. RAF12 TaxID=3233050 RepID=UPI003F9383F7
MKVEFYLDYRSPFAYLANSQAGDLPAVVDRRPVDVLSVMRWVNNQPSTACPSKARYSLLDASRWAKHYGVAFSPNRPLFNAMASRQFDGVILIKAALAAAELGVFETANSAFFSAVWASDTDLTSESSRDAFLRTNGLPSTLWEAAMDPSIDDRLAAQNQSAADRGVFGVPMFFVDDEMFFGNDRLQFVGDHLRKRISMGDAA